MSEAFKWGGSAPEAASAPTAGLNQEADIAEGGGSHTGMWRGVHGSAGPALCMYDRDRLSEQRVWLCESVSALMWKHTYACGGFSFILPVLTFDCLKCFLFLAIPLSLPSHLTHLKRTADAILGHLLFGMLHLCQDSFSLPLSVSLSSLGPASCWLRQVLRRQVRSTTLIPRNKKKKSPNNPFALLLFSFLFFPITATLLRLSLDGFV